MIAATVLCIHPHSLSRDEVVRASGQNGDGAFPKRKSLSSHADPDQRRSVVDGPLLRPTHLRQDTLRGRFFGRSSPSNSTTPMFTVLWRLGGLESRSPI